MFTWSRMYKHWGKHEKNERICGSGQRDWNSRVLLVNRGIGDFHVLNKHFAVVKAKYSGVVWCPMSMTIQGNSQSMQLDKVKRRACTETASLLGHSLNYYRDLSPFYLIIYLVADKSISVVSDHYLPHYSYIDFFIDKKKSRLIIVLAFIGQMLSLTFLSEPVEIPFGRSD